MILVLKAGTTVLNNSKLFQQLDRMDIRKNATARVVREVDVCWEESTFNLGIIITVPDGVAIDYREEITRS